MGEINYPLKLFLKLGKDSLNAYNGRQTIAAYKAFLEVHSSVWFCTSALATGMCKARQEEFLRAIKEGQTVEMYFGIGKVYDGVNKLYAKAKVIDIATGRNKLVSPEPLLTPEPWQLACHEIWIKLENLEELVDGERVEDFKIASSGAMLKEVIEKSQFHFGYIVRV